MLLGERIELLVQVLLLVLKIKMLRPYRRSSRGLLRWLSGGGAVQDGLIVRRDLFISHWLRLGIKANLLNVHRILVHIGHVGNTVVGKLLLRLLVQAGQGRCETAASIVAVFDGLCGDHLLTVDNVALRRTI